MVSATAQTALAKAAKRAARIAICAHQAISEPVPHPKFPAELLVLHLLPIALPTDKEQHGKIVLGLREQPMRVDS